LREFIEIDFLNLKNINPLSSSYIRYHRSNADEDPSGILKNRPANANKSWHTNKSENEPKILGLVIKQLVQLIIKND